ncbi:MAG: S9 family peptidase [Bacteroidales bacterium]|nr:S9 family peptidase [Bacteroidales bacterium]MBN2757983.1 S9 family peptidase [Bacteroidales bacterium]
MKKLIIPLVLFAFFACNQTQNQKKMSVIYPKTKKVDTIDVYFGTEVADPYRWLEDDLSEETANWVKAENEVTFGYLNNISFKDKIKQRLEKIWNFEKVGSPTKHGDYYYFYKNDGLQNQYVLYRTKDLKQKEADIFLDPNKFSEDGTVSMAGTSFTKDGSLMAYLISEGGSDWRKIIIKNTETNEIIEDTLIDVKFSGVSWKGNDGFYYSSYDKPKEGSQLSGKTQYHKLFYHKLGTEQKKDVLIFGGEKQPRRYIGAYLTEDENYLVITASQGTSGNELYIKDLSQKNSKIVTLVDNFDNDSYVVDNDGYRLFIHTNINAPNNRLVEVDAYNPITKNWIDLIPETENVLSVSTAGGNFFAEYMVDVKSKVIQYDLFGKKIREVELPAIGSASGFDAKKTDKELYYSFTSFTYPNTIFKYEIETGKSELYWKPAIDFNPEDYVTEQIFYTSKDSTKIPMFIVYKKGLKMNGKNPTYLYAYGGFNISLTPSFSVSRIIWLENGGVYAQPNLRGGGEYGEMWHKAGTQMKKQNVFDDFIAAAEYLKDNKYTSTDYLAIAGGSNGGLLIGATMTQRPDIAKVAFPAVGVLDMLRYHTFTSGAGWTPDYGNSDESKEMFEYLFGYSPVHNVKEAEYPATLITTGDHDDRVVPAHSFKFAAELQSKHKGDNPILIRIETSTGHGAGTPTSKIIEQYADIWSFAFYNMGINPIYK